MNTSQILLAWYDKNKRDLPWRKTANPYFIWLSEVILQQTRVEQGTSYYLKFIGKYPTVAKLAAANESEILKLWQGLGYYSRARNLHAAAKEIVLNHKGTFPASYADIRALKGIGDYTAAAISSFAFRQKHAVVDGNVFRFLSRYFGISTPINSTQAKKEFHDVAYELLADNAPNQFNQAIMEFGALQCKPSPDCSSCPLNSSCLAFENNSVRNFPVKIKKQKSRNRYFYYLVLRKNNAIYLNQRTGKDIWQNLYEFPLIETKKRIKNSDISNEPEWRRLFNSDEVIIGQISKERKHILSHQILHAKFVEINIKEKNFSVPSHWEKVSQSKISKYAVPRLIDKYLQEQESFYI